MGSVSMQSVSSSRGERLSAFVDGEWSAEEHLNANFFELDGEGRAAWSEYHLIGDVLRSDDLALSQAASHAFMSGFAARFEAEPHVLAPAALPQAHGVQAGRNERVGRILALRRRVMPSLAVTGGQDGNIIRDARLDEYLQAHQQFAQQPVMSDSMPFIRSAALSTQGQ
jgi:sigma-E factor negative regulatory protein RseA